MKLVVTIEARMNSTRLPGKVLLDLGGIKSIECQIKRLMRCRHINELIVATTTNACDDILVDFVESHGWGVYRGSEDDVTSRILGAAKSVDADIHVQTTGDCPLIDPEIVDHVIDVFLDGNGKYDFVSNEIERTFPIGLDCRVFSVEALERANVLCSSSVHRSHGSTFMYRSEFSNQFRSLNIAAPPELAYPDFRLTLDELKDFEFFSKIMEHFGSRVINLSSIELINWLKENPDVLKINEMVQQKNLYDR